MSVEAYQWAWRQSGLKNCERVVLLALCEYADDKGICWPSQITLAKRCEMRRNNVNAMLRRLSDMKLITISKRGKGRQYQLNIGVTLPLEFLAHAYK